MTMVLIAMMSCGNAESEQGNGTNNQGNSPSPRTDETQHPAGVSNQNVISTDTAAMNVERMHDTTGK